MTILSSVAVLAPLLLGGIILGLFFPILRSVCRKAAIEELSPSWLESFSVAAYYPMQGLLSDEDFTFLSRQPGFDESLYKKLQRERLHIFRQYLLRLIADFNRLHAVARLIVARGNRDRSDVMVKLMMLKFRFSLAVLEAECSYIICRIGFRLIAARRLIVALEDMSLQLAAISQAQAA